MLPTVGTSCRRWQKDGSLAKDGLRVGFRYWLLLEMAEIAFSNATLAQAVAVAVCNGDSHDLPELSS